MTMNNEPIAPMTINRRANLKAPLTPVAWMERTTEFPFEGVTQNLLRWNPIEYIGGYIVLKDGKEVARTRQTQYAATTPGEWQVIGYAGDGTQGFASEPRSNRPVTVLEFAGESTSMTSPEISYRPDTMPEGFSGAGFAETDRTMPSRGVTLDVAEEGVYAVRVRYANGNGPVNTENKAAVRTLSVDGIKAGTLVMPQRGVANWDDWGMSNGVQVSLTPGQHKLVIEYLPEDENMNIAANHAIMDRVEVVRVK